MVWKYGTCTSTCISNCLLPHLKSVPSSVCAVHTSDGKLSNVEKRTKFFRQAFLKLFTGRGGKNAADAEFESICDGICRLASSNTRHVHKARHSVAKFQEEEGNSCVVQAISRMHFWPKKKPLLPLLLLLVIRKLWKRRGKCGKGLGGEGVEECACSRVQKLVLKTFSF